MYKIDLGYRISIHQAIFPKFLNLITIWTLIVSQHQRQFL